MVKLLLKHGADVNGTDYMGETALHRAIKYGTVGLIDTLVEAGAAVDGCDGDYPSPLQVACGVIRGDFQVSSCDIVKALLGHGASVNVLEESGDSSLHYASRNRSAELVGLLLRAGADESDTNDYQETAADLVTLTHVDHDDFEAWSQPVLRLLNDAPTDRVWRRRGFLVLCRAFPDKARPAAERTRAKLSRAARRRAASGGGGEGAADELAVAATDSAFRHVVMGLVRMEEEGSSGTVVCFL